MKHIILTDPIKIIGGARAKPAPITPENLIDDVDALITKFGKYRKQTKVRDNKMLAAVIMDRLDNCASDLDGLVCEGDE